jgi:hypothetical protein
MLSHRLIAQLGQQHNLTAHVCSLVMVLQQHIQSLRQAMAAQATHLIHIHPQRLCLLIALPEQQPNQMVRVCKAGLHLTQRQFFRTHMTALALHLIVLRAIHLRPPPRQIAPLGQQRSQTEHVWKADLRLLIQEVQ